MGKAVARRRWRMTIRCGAVHNFCAHHEAVGMSPFHPTRVLPSPTLGPRCFKRGVVSLETIVHILITFAPWNAKIWFFVSFAQLYRSPSRLLGVRFRVFRGRACRRKFVVPNFDLFQASKLDELEWIHLLLRPQQVRTRGTW